MPLTYLFLDDITRQLMLQEFNYDIDCKNCYLSRRFNEFGNTYFIEIMPRHIESGNDETLAEDLKNKDCFKTHEERNTAKGVISVKVPITAADTFSEGEFNRFYIRALCLRAIQEGKKLEVYRARESTNPRSDSINLIGQIIDTEKLLEDLRNNKGIDTALGLPPGPNSGLSVKLQ